MKTRRLVSVVATAVVAAAMAVAVLPGAAHATPGDGWLGWYVKSSTDHYKTRYGMAAESTNGGKVYQMPMLLQPGSTQPYPYLDWLMTPEGDGAMSFRNAGSTNWLALAVPGGRKDKGAPIIVWNYEKGHREQQWVAVHLAGDSTGYNHIKNVNSGLCLAVPNASYDNFIGLIQWTCEGGHAEQQWASYDG